MEQFISGEIKKISRVNSHRFLIGLTIDGKHARQQEEEQKGNISIALMIQEKLFISELFKDIQEAILIDPSLQDNVVIQSGFFQHIYHIGCAFNLHSICCRSEFKQETNSILSAYRSKRQRSQGSCKD